ncbi:hypothetical protein HY772_06410 [Candidatus Woesearchaeota archaeon]|nr:hypothetical protein [Candidatus Woesearchaeota archaeon]
MIPHLDLLEKKLFDCQRTKVIISSPGEQGNRTAAVLPLPEYGALLERLLDDAALGRLVRQIPPDQRTTGREAHQFFAYLEA